MPLLPWEDSRAKIDGSALEKLVVDVLTEAGQSLTSFRVEHQELIVTPDGQYRIDVTARFRQLAVDFLLLVECKDHTRPVEREDVQVLADKKRAAEAHKAILFATNGFQKGAIEYARIHGIALVRVCGGQNNLRDESCSSCWRSRRTTGLGEHTTIRRTMRAARRRQDSRFAGGAGSARRTGHVPLIGLTRGCTRRRPGGQGRYIERNVSG